MLHLRNSYILWLAEIISADTVSCVSECLYANRLAWYAKRLTLNVDESRQLQSMED